LDTKPISFRRVPKQRELLGDLINTKTIKRLAKIAEGWYAIGETNGFLYFNDLRFGVYDLNAQALNFAFSYKLLPNKNGFNIEEKKRDPQAMKTVLISLWKRVWGN